MASPNTQRRNKIMLGAIVVMILAAFAYVYRDSLLPKPVKTRLSEKYALPQAEFDEHALKEKDLEALFAREDFRSLTQFGDVPVRALPAEPGKPFAEPAP